MLYSFYDNIFRFFFGIYENSWGQWDVRTLKHCQCLFYYHSLIMSRDKNDDSLYIVPSSTNYWEDGFNTMLNGMADRCLYNNIYNFTRARDGLIVSDGENKITLPYGRSFKLHRDLSYSTYSYSFKHLFSDPTLLVNNAIPNTINLLEVI